MHFNLRCQRFNDIFLYFQLIFYFLHVGRHRKATKPDGIFYVYLSPIFCDKPWNTGV